MRHEVSLGHNIDEVKQVERGYANKPTTFIMIDDIYVNQVIKDLQGALQDLQRIKR